MYVFIFKKNFFENKREHTDTILEEASESEEATGTTGIEEAKKAIGSEETSALKEAVGLLEVTVSGFIRPVMFFIAFSLLEM